MIAATVHSGVDWTAVGVISAAAIAIVGGVAKLAIARGERARAELAGKLDAIGEHLEKQDAEKDDQDRRLDDQHRQVCERLARLEGRRARRGLFA